MAFGRAKSLLELAQQAQEETIAANAAREAEIRALHEQNLQSFAPEGAFAKAGERAIERTYSQDVSRMVGAGLYGTTAVESTAGAARRQGRLTLESMLEEGRGRARSAYADFIERIENKYPDLGAVYAGYAAQSSMPSSTSGTSPATRPGWAIGYGQEPLERATPTATSSVPVTGTGQAGQSKAYGRDEPTPSVHRTSSQTLADLYAQGRASMDWEETPLMQKKKKKTPTYNQLISQINPWL